jgi:hypothetical protein
LNSRREAITSIFARPAIARAKGSRIPYARFIPEILEEVVAELKYKWE